MADKAIADLIPAENLNPSDSLLVEQFGTAKRLTGQVLINFLVKAADGHGGIKSWEIVSGPGPLDFKLVLTLSQTNQKIEVPMKNGRSLDSIELISTSGTVETGIVKTYKLSFSDETSQNIQITDGRKGDKGDATYTHVRYASVNPSQPPHSFGAIPDNWLGIYVGPRSAAPTLWSDYQWFQIKGDKGDVGDPATIKSQKIEYQASTSGTLPPSGSWVTTPPIVAKGQYLWSRTTIQFNSGSALISYGVSYMGRDGLGTVSSFAGYTPDPMGNIDPQKWNLEVNHPVRSWWFSDDPKSPAELFGGTWEKMEGRMLIGASSKYTAGSTYGSESVKLNISNIPPLGLDVYFDGNYNNSDIDQWKMFLQRGAWAQQETAGAKKQIGSFGSTHGGASEPVQTLGPVYATYIWRRIA